MNIDLQIADDCQVIGNASDLKRAVVSVAQNAAQSGARTVLLGVGRVGTEAVVRVRDDGRGMAEHVLARALEPGFTTRADGTGLGLSMVERILTAHGGRVEVESEVGRGTTVKLVLPLVR